MQTKSFKWFLDKSSKKFKCPQCGHKTLVRYMDADKNYLPEHVGRCDRENRCAYHCPPKQHFAETQQRRPFATTRQEAPPPQRVDVIPHLFLLQSSRHALATSFGQYLTALFGRVVAEKLLIRYGVGRSRQDDGQACIFWQTDIKGNVRSGKIVAYNAATGKRIKQAEAQATGRGLRNSTGEYMACLNVNPLVRKALGNMQLQFSQCFFGEHLLAEYPGRPVCIVESEKTAMLCSVIMPNAVWLATGGANGCKWREYSVHKVLEGRSVSFYPDYGYYNLTTQTTCYSEWTNRVDQVAAHVPGNFRVHDLLETILAGKPRNDQDLADLFIVRDPDTGLALNDSGYPVLWDIDGKEWGIEIDDFGL